MAGNSSPVSLCNQALLRIGQRNQINSLNGSDVSTEAQVCATLYQSTYDSLARAARWNCFRKQAVLTMIAAAQGTPENPNGTSFPLPPTPFLYTYLLPPDCLAMRYIVPSLPSGAGSVPPPTSASVSAPTWLPGQGGQIYFQVAYSTDSANNPIEVILTNQSQAQAVYTVNQPNPAIWDSMFSQAFIAALAAFLVPALSLNMALAQMQAKMADGIIAEARAADANEGVTVMDVPADWIVARGGESGYYFWNSGMYGGIGNCDVAWPC